MFIFVIIGLVLYKVFARDFGHWLRWFNAEHTQWIWLAKLADIFMAGGWLSVCIWMVPFIWVAVMGTVRTGFSGTRFGE